MAKKRIGILKKVAKETGYSYSHVRNVVSGQVHNEIILKAVLKAREEELKKLQGKLKNQ